MKIGLIGQKNSTNLLYLKEEFEILGYECFRLYIQDFIFAINPDFYVEHRKQNLINIDLFIVAGYQNNEIELIDIICSELTSKGKKVIGYPQGVEHYLSTLNRVSKSGIKVLKHFFTKGLKSARDSLIEINHPIMILCRGEKMNWCVSEDWTESYDFLRANKSREYEFKLLPSDKTTFYSSYILDGNEVLLLEKKVQDNNYNYSLKFNKKVITDARITDLALKVHNLSGFYFSRVDIGIDEDSLVLIDIFRFPKMSNIKKFDKDMVRKVCESLIT